MSDERLQRLLARAGDDGRAQAELRAWPVAREAFARRSADGSPRRAWPRGREAVPDHSTAAEPRRPSRALVAVAAVAALCLLTALAVTKPGEAVADWLREHIGGKPGVTKSAPALTHLPGGGRLVVAARQGVWIVDANGSRRLLRGYRGAVWSPRGLYLGAWRGHELSALEPGGRVHWSLARSGPIRAAAWSPEGYRVAYLSGRALRVVAGDGTGDVLLRPRVAPVAPAWRPHAPHLLAVAARPRVIDVVATDAHALAWRYRVAQRARALAWSADGRMLAVAGRTEVTILDGASGRALRRIAAPPSSAISAIAFAPSGSRLAMVAPRTGGRTRLLTVDLARRHAAPRLLFTGAGGFSQVRWSPDGRWVLIAWPAANQWLFVRSAHTPGLSAVRDIARQFDPGTPAPRFPALGGWCCG
jgi:hypothetical protein